MSQASTPPFEVSQEGAENDDEEGEAEEEEDKKKDKEEEDEEEDGQAARGSNGEAVCKKPKICADKSTKQEREEHSSSSHNPSATLDKETEAKPCAVHGGRGKNQTSAPLCFLHADSEAGSATDLQHTLKLRFPVALRTLVVSSPDSGCAREQVVDVPAQQVRGLLRRLVRCGGPQVKGIEVWFQRLKRSGQCGAARRDADLMQQRHAALRGPAVHCEDIIIESLRRATCLQPDQVSGVWSVECGVWSMEWSGDTFPHVCFFPFLSFPFLSFPFLSFPVFLTFQCVVCTAVSRIYAGSVLPFSEEEWLVLSYRLRCLFSKQPVPATLPSRS